MSQGRREILSYVKGVRVNPSHPYHLCSSLSTAEGSLSSVFSLLLKLDTTLYHRYKKMSNTKLIFAKQDVPGRRDTGTTYFYKKAGGEFHTFLLSDFKVI